MSGGPLLLLLLVVVLILAVWTRALIERRARRRRLRDTRTLQGLRAMRWQDFEKLVADAYRADGWRVVETGRDGTDGGVDLILRRHGEVVLAVQCKKWTADVVGVSLVRELQGALADAGAGAGVFVTASYFTQDAIDFAGRHRMELVDGGGLLALLDGVRDEAVPAAAAAAATVAPAVGVRCPDCGSPMRQRRRRADGSPFWGCREWPRCSGTRPA